MCRIVLLFLVVVIGYVSSNPLTTAPPSPSIPNSFDVKQDVPTERAALIRFYHSTNGPSWLKSTNWLDTSVSHCTWYGIECRVDNNINHVYGLLLDNNRLTGSIPSDLLCEFPYVGFIYLTDNHKLSGYLPDMSCLSELRWLRASSCSFYGPIPSFQSNPYLEVIQLFENQFNSVPTTWINGLQLLEQVMIQHNPIGYFPPPLDVPKLNFIQVTNCSLSDAFSDMSGVPVLYSLFVANNQLTSLPDFSSHSRFVQLRAANNRLTSFPTGLSPGRLLELDVSYNFISGPIPTELLTIPMLAVLNLAHNSISGGLPNLAASRWLQTTDISCNQFFDIGNPIWPINVFYKPPVIQTICYDGVSNVPQNTTCVEYCRNATLPTLMPPTQTPVSVSSSTTQVEGIGAETNVSKPSSTQILMWIGVSMSIIVVLILMIVIYRVHKHHIPSTHPTSSMDEAEGNINTSYEKVVEA